MRPKISVIVTSYNIEKYIAQCLDGIVSQTIKEIEIIVVDDGSNDCTPQIIHEYAARDARIKPIFMEKNSPGGVATAANIGIEAAIGDYIGFADGDDLYDTTMFEKLYLSAIETNSDVAMCAFQEFDTETMEIDEPFDPKWDKVSNLSYLDISSSRNKKKILKLLPVPWRKIYKKDLLISKNMRFPECDYFFEDNYFHWIITLNTKRVSFVNEVLCSHRRNRIGQTMMNNGNKLLGVFYQHELICNYLRNNNLFNLYKDTSINWLVGHIAWVSSVISSKYAGEFYDVLLPHLKFYKKNSIRKNINKIEWDPKTISLVVTLLSKNKVYFIKAISNCYPESKQEKLYYNYNRFGPFSFMVQSIIYFLKRKYKKIREKRKLRNKKKNLLLAIDRLNYIVDNLDRRINSIESITKIGFISLENKLDKLIDCNIDKDSKNN